MKNKVKKRLDLKINKGRKLRYPLPLSQLWEKFRVWNEEFRKTKIREKSTTVNS
jgi:hypothetical protein